KDGREKPVIIGCYGIWLSRLMGAIVETNHDDKGIIWPKEVAPFLVHLIEIKSSRSKVKSISEKIYADLQKNNIQVLYDDRQDKSVGEKFAEADLLGIPYRVVISEKTLAKNCVEVKERNKNQARLVKIGQFIKNFRYNV
ncbi:MAG: His/Gly/Thr/Pro-type tRNA ligase C-terminal domain-containing protein, partial [Patescibacteria group bacterium]